MVLDHNFECKISLQALSKIYKKKSVPKVSFYEKIKYHLQELKQKWVSIKSLNIKNYQLQELFKLLYIVSNIKNVCLTRSSSLVNLSNRNWNACFTDSVSIRCTLYQI